MTHTHTQKKICSCKLWRRCSWESSAPKFTPIRLTDLEAGSSIHQGIFIFLNPHSNLHCRLSLLLVSFACTTSSHDSARHPGGKRKVGGGGGAEHLTMWLHRQTSCQRVSHHRFQSWCAKRQSLTQNASSLSTVSSVVRLRSCWCHLARCKVSSF